MKLFLKHHVAHLVSDNPESIPSVVVFTVDVLNGLYSSICMQSSGTWLTSTLMILMNITFTVLSTSEINRAAKIFCKLDREIGELVAPPIARRASRLLQSSSTLSQGLVIKHKIRNAVAMKTSEASLSP
ncbi:hypothetical protein JG687_00007244 [Phytophthora cactorum]|uniref:Uncharacterized protein n=1 Tax=Phytophthora cactorum TaxID=29920 RepID=A0A8T1UKU9_9STRA|nr:hypothetical protein JG687_00007244 [Phytophthora cactorum]